MREELRRPESMLIWLAGALGDSLLAYPALAALRRWAPRAIMTITGTQSYFLLAARLGLVDRIYDASAAEGTALFAGDLATIFPRPELAIIWSSAYADFARRLVAAGVPGLIASPPRPQAERHQARYLLDCLAPLGVPRTLLPIAPPAPVPASPTLATMLRGVSDRRWVLLHPGAGARWKRWPLDNFIALATHLQSSDLAVLWSLGPADDDLRLVLEGRGVALPGVLLPPLALDDLACVAGSSALLVSADTGIAHLAALWQTPQVALFGPTNPQRWRPLSRRAIVVEAPDRCGGGWDGQGHPGGLRRCPTGGPHCVCLAALSMAEVSGACRSALSGQRRVRPSRRPAVQSPGP